MDPRGAEDVVRAASALASRLPWPLAVLARLAYNYRWAWLPDGPEVFCDVDPARWAACGRNPVRLLQETSAEALLRAAADASLVARAEQLEAALIEDLARPPASGVADAEHPVAFFCAEYGLHVSLPIYAGGLGALAGDILKEASDRALPLVAVGLMYGRGYFRQRIDHTGWQQEYWVPTDPERSPAVLVTIGDDRAPLRIDVPIGADDVVAQVWRVDIGRVPLFLLDTDVPENGRVARWITTRLYDSDPQTRLAQYVLLGCGGAAALRALGDRAGDRAHERGPRGVRGAGDDPPAGRGRRRLRGRHSRPSAGERSSRRTRRSRPATTRTRPSRCAPCWPRSPRSLGTDRRGDRPARAHASRRRARAVRRHAVRPAREPRGERREPAPRRRLARHVAGAVARPRRRRRADRPRDQRRPRPVVGRRADAPPARSPPRRRAGRERASDPATFEAIDAIPAGELWAVRCEQRRAARRVRPRPQPAAAHRARRPARVRRGVRQGVRPRAS